MEYAKATVISDTRARRIASGWYEGDGSALYLIVCNDDYTKLETRDITRARREAEACKGFARSISEKRELYKLIVWLRVKESESESERGAKGHKAPSN